MGGGSQGCRALWSLLFCGDVLTNYSRAKSKVKGNSAGEGLVTGGLFVMGPGKQGVIFSHVEKFIGDTLIKDGRSHEVLEAVGQIKPAKARKDARSEELEEQLQMK